MTMRTRYLASVPLALLLAACGQADSETVLETVRMTEQAQLQAIAADDLGGAVRNYDAEAVMVSAGSDPVAGAEAIRASFEQLLADPNFALEVTPGTGWASEAGDMAVTTFTGQLTTTDPDSGEAVTVPVGNQTVWRRSDGTPWKIVSEYTVALPAPAEAPEAAPPA